MTVLINQHLEFEGVPAVRTARPPAGVWHELASARPQTALSSTPLLRAELVIADGRGRRQASLPIDFDRRVQSGPAVSLLGSGGKGALQVSLDTELPPSGVKMRFRFTPHADSTPLELNPVINWFEALAPDRQLGLRMRDGGRWGIEPTLIPPDHPQVPKDYARAVHVLARIQQRSGSVFAMPEEIDGEDAEAIGLADALVKGQTIPGRWADASIQEDLQLLSFLKDSEHGAMLEFRATHRLRLDTQDVEVGEVEYRFFQIRYSEHDEEDHVIRLMPGQNDRFEVRLVAVTQKPRDDGATNWVPAAMLEPYAGLWVAQSGTQVLFATEDFAETAGKVRASGRLATIWRVPASVEEAEALPAVGL